MDIPILKRRGYLIAFVRAPLTDDELIRLRERLAAHVTRHRAHGVIIDLSGMDVMDSFSVKNFRDLADGIRLRGADTVVVGLAPDVAFAMAELDFRLPGITTAMNLEQGLHYLDRKRHGWRAVEYQR